VNESLRKNIIAQDEAINAVMRAVTYLHSRRESKRYSPLVLAITGPTGVGKSESAKLIGKGLYGLSSYEDQPCGLLMLSGKAYSGMSRLRVGFLTSFLCILMFFIF
jgi:DNA polymerase III gamma/tau subunit